MIEEPLDLSPQELTEDVATENIQERLPELIQSLSRLKGVDDTPTLEFSLVQTTKSLAYLLQDLLTATGRLRQAGQMDSVAATLGEVTAHLTKEILGEPIEEVEKKGKK